MKKTDRKKTFLIVMSLVLLAVPPYIGYQEGHKNYVASGQPTYIQQFWLPADADITFDTKEWEKKIGVESRMIKTTHHFESYKTLFENGRHIALILPGYARYGTMEGKAVRITDVRIGKPSYTSVREFTYLGDGKLELKLVRDMLTIVTAAVCAAILFGGCIYLSLMAFLWYVCMRLENRQNSEASEHSEQFAELQG